MIAQTAKSMETEKACEGKHSGLEKRHSIETESDRQWIDSRLVTPALS